MKGSFWEVGWWVLDNPGPMVCGVLLGMLWKAMQVAGDWAGPRKVLASWGYHKNPDVVLGGGRQLFCQVPLACVQESLKSVSGSWFMKRVARLE